MESCRPYRGCARRLSAGFTLVEMTIVLAIILVITSIMLTNQTSFNKSLLITNTAYDIALSLRNAQTYGLSSRAAGAVANTGYGIHFERAAPGAFTLFADLYPTASASSPCHPAGDPTSPAAQPGDCAYEAGQNERVLTYGLGNGVTIGDFCAYSGGTWACATSGSASLASLDIIFSRPNPDPFMSVNGAYAASFPVTAACITVTSPQGGARYVSVAATGEISANAASCP